MLKSPEEYLAGLEFDAGDHGQEEIHLTGSEKAFVEKYLGLDALENLPLVDPEPVPLLEAIAEERKPPFAEPEIIVVEPGGETRPGIQTGLASAEYAPPSAAKTALAQLLALPLEPERKISALPVLLAERPVIVQPQIITVVEEQAETALAPAQLNEAEFQKTVVVEAGQAATTEQVEIVRQVAVTEQVEIAGQVEIGEKAAVAEAVSVQTAQETTQKTAQRSAALQKMAVRAREAIRERVAARQRQKELELIRQQDLLAAQAAETVQEEVAAANEAQLREVVQKEVAVADKAAVQVAEAQSAAVSVPVLSEEAQLKEKMKAMPEILMVSFLVGEQLFLLPVIGIREVLRHMELIKVPNAPTFVAGAINLRGRVTPIVQLSALLTNGETPPYDAGKFIIIAGADTIQLGLVIDKVSSMHLVPQEKIIWNPESKLAEAAEFLNAIVDLDDKVCGMVSPEMIVKLILPEVPGLAGASGKAVLEYGKV